MKEINVDKLRRQLETGEDLVVPDVREPDEAARTVVPGSVNILLDEVADRIEELDASYPTAVVYVGGVRFAKAIKALIVADYTDELPNISGDTKVWLGQ